MRIPRLPLACLLLVALAVAARAAEPAPEIALQRALDQPLTLSLQSVPLSEAFKQIAATAKIPLTIDPACYELLPYGDTTLVSVDFKQSKLREALDVLLLPVGLQTTIAGSAVMVRPSDPLKHIGRRANWEELKLLKELWSSPDLKAPAPPATGPFNLTDAIRAVMESRKDLLCAIPPDSETTVTSAQAMEQVAKQLPLSAYRALEIYCQQTGTFWFVETSSPTGGKISVLTPRQWIARQLERPIQLSRKDEPLEVIVADLTHASGIRFVPEPGLYQSVPVVSLRSDNGTVLQTLEALAGATRITFDVRDDSILLHLAPGPGNAPPRADTIIGRISVPAGPDNGMMDVYIRESDLTAEQNELRKKRIEDAVKAMQKAWTTPPAPPTPITSTTQPKPE